MRRAPGSALRFLILAAAATLVPLPASAQVLSADLNGDGIHDRVDPGARPTEIVVRLSAGQPQHRLHADSPIIRLAAFDFNRDGHVDLVATTRTPGGLAVWINRGNGRFSRRLVGHPARARFERDGAAARSSTVDSQQADDNGEDGAGGPLVITSDTRLSHDVSYLKRARETRVLHVRFHGRSLVPRGPPRA